MSLYILLSSYVSTCVWGIRTCPCSWRLEVSTEYLPPPPLSTLTFAPGFVTKLAHWLTRLCGWHAPGTLLSLLPSTRVGCRCEKSTLRAPPCLHSKPFTKWASPQAMLPLHFYFNRFRSHQGWIWHFCFSASVILHNRTYHRRLHFLGDRLARLGAGKCFL